MRRKSKMDVQRKKRSLRDYFSTQPKKTKSCEKESHQGKGEFQLQSNIIIKKVTEAFNTTDKPHLNTMANYRQSTTHFQKSFQRVAETSANKDLFHLTETVVSIPLLRFQRQEDSPLPKIRTAK